jgi:hypothetical protein
MIAGIIQTAELLLCWSVIQMGALPDQERFATGWMGDVTL